jgi:hypothetical protein
MREDWWGKRCCCDGRREVLGDVVKVFTRFYSCKSEVRRRKVHSDGTSRISMEIRTVLVFGCVGKVT